MASHTIAILGRPNVGKSTLFNRLVGERKAIVSPIEGVTRDRIYSPFEWSGREMKVIDTGGFLPNTDDVMNRHIQEQARIATTEADLILFMVDGRDEITSSDRILCDMVQRSQKPSVLVVNKIDSSNNKYLINNFFELGLGEPFPVSAQSGSGVGDLLDLLVSMLDSNVPLQSDIETDMNLAIVGMPNVGKSSLMNGLLKEEKAIVTDIAGTTRDSVDSYIKYFGKTVRIIDTAGLRKRSKVDEDIEFYSSVRTQRVIEDCDVAAVVIDGAKGFGKQDKDIVRNIIDNGKGMVLVINKWDLIEKDNETMKNMSEDIDYSYTSTAHYPKLFISVKNNLRLTKVLDESIRIHNRYVSKTATSLLNEILKDIVGKYPPPAVKGKHLKIKYATQIRHSPPLFAIFMNHPHLVPISYKRYMENQLRDKLDLSGVPIKISFRQK